MGDVIHVIIVICGISIAVVVISKIRIWAITSYYAKKQTLGGVSAHIFASAILNAESICGVNVQYINGNLTDCYSPRAKTIRLSERVYGCQSVMAVAVAAHEAGHALQHEDGYGGLTVKRATQPLTRLGIITRQFLRLMVLLWKIRHF